ncbi:spore germination protein [Paenibacillus sp. N4]|uniref:GerAB/ArcD/ProY family transporter n=1 Tax=Paenibacillus vietnamensis TaxID=2590547 RepID=UPI001CD04549|nr:endospore germination permease [Paenibacillus vietnamensis]MCA0758709.1 spore germination protein [Paenibacillus vietnamensis]
MNKTTISHFQLGVLLFVFMTGSSIINIPGPLIARAGNAAWLSLMLSGACGFLVLAMLLFLHNRFPGLTYIDYSRKLIGNTMTVILGFLPLSFLFHMQSAIVVDVGLFMVSSMLRETPLYAFTLPVFLIAGLTARAGLEVIARMFTLIMLLTAFSISAVLLLAIPDFHPNMLLPVLPKGFKAVLHGAFLTFGFPYVEVFLFGMLIPFGVAQNQKKASRALYIALGLNIFILCISTVSAIMVYGSYAGERPYVLFALARLVEFQEIIQRIESIIGMSLILGSYMKVTITIYVISVYLSKMFMLKDNSKIIMPIALFGFLMGLVAFDGSTQWAGLVATVHPVWAGCVFFLPLVLLTVIAAFRKPGSTANKNNAQK